jgi:hypothetical protein
MYMKYINKDHNRSSKHTKVLQKLPEKPLQAPFNLQLPDIWPLINMTTSSSQMQTKYSANTSHKVHSWPAMQ